MENHEKIKDKDLLCMDLLESREILQPKNTIKKS